MKAFDANERRDVTPGALETRDEVLRLRRTVRDLVALSSLPSIWVDCEVERSLQNLTDVLRATLRALTVCVRIEMPDGSRFETAASESLSHGGPRTFHPAELLDEVPSDSNELVSIPRFKGTGPINALPHPVFAEGRQTGNLVACFREDSFPGDNERLILQVAANQVTLLLQRHKAQEERFARKLAEDRLRRAEHHYQQLVQSLPAAVYTCDNEGRITLYNEAAAKLWGRRPKLGEDLWCGSWKIFKPDGSPLPLNECPMAIAIREGRSVRGQEIIVERPDGTRAWVLPHPDPIRDEAGKIVGTVNMLVQVDELKRAEQTARTNEARIQSLLTLMPAAVYACDAEGRFTFYNPRAVELWGCEPRLQDDKYKFCAMYKCWFDGKQIPPDETPMAVAVREGKAFRNLEPTLERPDGTRLSVLINIDPLFDAEGNPAGAINVFQDVTALKNAEAELRRKNGQLATFLETAALGLHRVGPEGIIQWANDAELQLLGYSPEEYIGHHISEFHADQAVIDDILKRLTCGEKLYGCEAHLRCKDGSIKTVLIDSSVLWEDGKFLHTQCFTRDITEKKQTEEALHLSSRLPTENPAPVLRVDRNYVLHFANPKGQEFLSEWKGAVGEPAPPPVVQLLGRGERHDAEISVDDGIYSVAVVPVLEGKFINLYFSDVTDRKKAEEALRESEGRFRLATNAGAVGVWDWDIVADRVSWSDSIYEIHGLQPAEFAGTVEAFAALVHPDDRAVVQEAVQRALRGEAPYEMEFRSVRPDGNTIWIYTTAQVIRDASGQPLRMLGSTVDITRRKEAEKALEQRTRVLEVVNRTGGTLAAELDLEKLVQAVTDAGREISGAHLGAFFYNARNEKGEFYTLYTLSGVPREAFSQFPMPRNTALFGPTFNGSGAIRLDDVLQDPRYGKNAPFHGMPKGHLPVRSYLAVPVVSRSGEVLGGLFYGHPTPGVFTEEAEKIITGIAAQAAVAIDNAQLFRAAQLELAERKRAENALRESKALLESQKDSFHAAMRGSSLEESLAVLVRSVIESTGGRARAAFYIASPDGKALHHIVGMPEHYAKAVDGFPVSSESLACGLAVHTGQAEIAVDVEQDPKWEAYRWLARHHNFRACWSFPLRTKDSVANGTLAMYFQEPCAPTPREMELATVIAHAATVIISRHQQSAERERAEQELRKRGERLQLLSDTLAQLISARNPDTIVRELFPKVAAHLGVDTYFNFMLESGGEGLRLHSCAGIPEETARGIQRLEFGQAICGTVAQTRQPIHATDIQNSDYDKAALVRGFGIQCYACNPLIVGERLLGTLSFASRTRTAFDDDELQFLQIISQYAAVALDRLQAADMLERTVAERTTSLREAIAQMEEFWYTVSHDLRAPLRAMQGYSQVLLEEYGSSLPPDALHYLSRIAAATDRLDKMVLDVLTFSRIARSEFKLERIHTDQLVRQMVEQYPGMQPPRVKISIEPLHDVLGHEPSLTQAVSNLLSNAVKFTQPGVKPCVRIWSEQHNGHVRLWVEDNGIGVDPKYQHRLFNMFERVHPDLKYEGTGMGLAIVRKAVERMGAKAGMESDGMNGSRFWLELPRGETTP